MTFSLRKCFLFVAMSVITVVLSSGYAEERSTNSGDKPNITFLARDAGALELVNDTLESYFSRLQPLEMTVKTGSPITGKTIEEQRAECRRRYAAAVMEFSEKEKSALKYYIEAFYPKLWEKYPRFARLEWRFIKVANNIEGGLPHTRGKCIVLSQKVVDVFVGHLDMYRAAKRPMTAVFVLGGTLIHEQVHVFQRLNPGVFDEVYGKLWGFRKAKKIEENEWLRKRQVLNPDGLDLQWVIDLKIDGVSKTYWPLVAFNGASGEKRMPEDFRMYLVELKGSDGVYSVELDKKKRPVRLKILECKEYRAKFMGSSNIYHPNEVFADIYAEMVKFEILRDTSLLPAEVVNRINEVFGEFKKWSVKIFNGGSLEKQDKK